MSSTAQLDNKWISGPEGTRTPSSRLRTEDFAVELRAQVRGTPRGSTLVGSPFLVPIHASPTRPAHSTATELGDLAPLTHETSFQRREVFTAAWRISSQCYDVRSWQSLTFSARKKVG